MLTFIWPWAFVLLPLPLLVRRGLPPRQSDSDGALKVPFFAALRDQLGDTDNARRSARWKWLLLSLAWLCLLTALARPAIIGDKEPLPIEGRDLMLAMDLSGSMEERDLSYGRTRLSIAKSAADQFIARRDGDRVGLVLFSDRAYVQAPLTFDRQVVRDLLKEALVGLTGQKTAIGDAIAISLKRLKDLPQKVGEQGQYGDSRVIILLTDGASNAGVMQPLKAAELAQKLGIKIYTIGVGSRGNGVFQRNEPDEATLKAIAQATGGRYFRATNADELAEIYRDIDKLEPIVGEPIFVRPETALYYLPAMAAAVLLGLLMLASILLNRGKTND